MAVLYQRRPKKFCVVTMHLVFGSFVEFSCSYALESGIIQFLAMERGQKVDFTLQYAAQICNHVDLFGTHIKASLA